MQPTSQNQQTRTRSRAPILGQLDLFAKPSVPVEKAGSTLASKVFAEKPICRHVVQSRAAIVAGETHSETKTVEERPALERVVTVDDMPSYSTLERDLVEKTIAALPPGKMWFTYAAVWESFGISRATVARRVKDGLVPGIRFRGANVLEDGPVRRFDRAQLLWLLLSVRTRRRPENAKAD